MTTSPALVKAPSVPEPLLRPELTLSAVGAIAQPPDRTPAPPPEAVVRDERDPYIATELELRYAWGDR